MRTLYVGILALIFTVAQLAAVTVALAVGGSGIGAVPFLLYANAIGVAVMLAIIHWQGKWGDIAALFRDRRMLLITLGIAVLVSVISESFLLVGTLWSNANVGSIIYRTYPIMIVALSPLLMRQKVTAWQLAAVLFAAASMYVIMSNGTLLSINYAQLPAMALLFGSAIIVTLTTILIRKYNINGTIFATMAAAVAVLFFLPVSVVMHIGLPTGMPLSTALAVVFTGAIDFGVGGALFYYSYKIFNTSVTGMALLSVPFLTVVLSFLLIGVQFQPYYILAAALLGIGMLMQARNPFTAPEYAKSKAHKHAHHMQIFDVTSAFIDTKIEHIYRAIRTDGRVLAVKINREMHGNIVTRLESEAKKEFRTLVCMHTDRDYVSAEQSAFISDIMGLDENEACVLFAGGMAQAEADISDVFNSA